MVVMVVLQRFLPRLPAGFIALTLATVVVSTSGLEDRVPVVGKILPTIQMAVDAVLRPPAASRREKAE
jgi:hypothetical protein